LELKKKQQAIRKMKNVKRGEDKLAYSNKMDIVSKEREKGEGKALR